jgi:hypothetical protein
MKNGFKIIALATAVLILTAGLSSCQHMSPKSVARACLTDYKFMYAYGVADLHNHKNDEERYRFTENLKEYFEKMPETQRAEIKTAKFKSYKKNEGGKDTEKGTLTVSFRPDGKGERITESTEFSFVKVKNKWYLSNNAETT